MEAKRSPILCDNNNCTGCSSCGNSCPVGAIAMRQEPVEGFYRPVIDADKCIKCLKCERACPVITPTAHFGPSDEIYAAWHADAEIRKNSSSGGAFSALAQATLERGGLVVGAAYDENLNLNHIVIRSADELPRLRASKYFQSRIGDVYSEALDALKAGTHVLFCGAPCQVAGFRGFLGNRQFDNLVLVDFICHGIPSPKFFHSYLDWLSGRYGKIVNFSFRSKVKGWYDAMRIADNGIERQMKGDDDAYWIGFNTNVCLQEACYKCSFKGEGRYGDITISDFWGIGTSEPFGHKDQIEQGVSMLMINSNNGMELFERARKYMECYPRTRAEVVKGNHSMVQSAQRPAGRNDFYKSLDNEPFDVVRKRYLEPDIKNRAVKMMREYFPSWFLQYLRLRKQK